MDSENTRDAELVARLKRLDAGAGSALPGFDYDGLLERHSAGVARSRRRLLLARGAAVVLLLALVGASFWRLDVPERTLPNARNDLPAPAPVVHPRIVRADTWFAVSALEDHIATVDDALNYARARGATLDVARLERTRAELLDSYSQVRYAEMVAANF